MRSEKTPLVVRARPRHYHPKKKYAYQQSPHRCEEAQVNGKRGIRSIGSCVILNPSPRILNMSRYDGFKICHLICVAHKSVQSTDSDPSLGVLDQSSMVITDIDLVWFNSM